MKLNEFTSGAISAVAMPMGQVQRRIPKKKKKVQEMDSQQPTGKLKADGTRSHSSYGSRDNDQPYYAEPLKLDIPLRRHMLKKLAWETDWDLSDLEHLTDKELADLYHEKVADARDFYNDLKANANAVLSAKTLKHTMESIKESKSWDDYGMPTAEEEPKKKPERRLHSWFQYWEEKDKQEKEQAVQPVKEFAPDSNGDGGEEDTLLKYARMWYNGDLEVQQQVEKILDRLGWEIGELESEEGGCFVVKSGDENGNSYIGFAPADLTESSLNEFAKKGVSESADFAQMKPQQIVSVAQQAFARLFPGVKLYGKSVVEGVGLTTQKGGEGTASAFAGGEAVRGEFYLTLNAYAESGTMIVVVEDATSGKYKGAASAIIKALFEGGERLYKTTRRELAVKDNANYDAWSTIANRVGAELTEGLEETKQRLDPKCWKGYKKQGTKMKGGVRVNNCVPEAANPAQQAAIAIAKKKKKNLKEFSIDDNDDGDDGDSGAKQAHFVFNDKGRVRKGTVFIFPGEYTDVEYSLDGMVYSKTNMTNVTDHDEFITNAKDFINEIIQLNGDGDHFVEKEDDVNEQRVVEAPIEIDREDPTNPMIYGHNKANPAKLQYRMMRAANQFRDLAERVNKAQDAGSLTMWQSIVANFEELAMNVDQIGHALKELEKTRRKGGVNSRGIPDLS